MPAQLRCAAISRRNTRPLLLAVLFIASAPARASDVDTEHLFGFTEGADIGKAGECEAETEIIGRFGKSAGSYAVVTQNDSVKWLPSDNLRLAANGALAYFGISGVPGLPDSQLATLQGLSFEVRYKLIDRELGPFGLTLIAEPRWGRVDATSVETATSYGGTLILAADKELIRDRLFGTVNLLYDSQATRFPGQWIDDSRIGLSAALSTQVAPTFFLGGEIRYLRGYDGLGLDSVSGQALFAGPTFYLRIAKGMALSGAWNLQIAGHTASGASLDLMHFERQQAKVRFNVNF